MNLWTEVFNNENYLMSFSEYWVFSEGSFIVLFSQLFLLISMQIAIVDINAKCHCWYWRLVLGSQRFPVRVQALAMCRGEFSAVIPRLMSKCLWSGWKCSAFPCSPVICQCSRNKTHIEKNKKNFKREWNSVVKICSEYYRSSFFKKYNRFRLLTRILVWNKVSRNLVILLYERLPINNIYRPITEYCFDM